MGNHAGHCLRCAEKVFGRRQVIVPPMDVDGSMAHEHPAFVRINASTSHGGGGGVTQALQDQTTVLADDLVNPLVQAFSDG